MTDAFEQPGPGGWKRLGDHFPGAATLEYQRLYAETCPPGMAAYMEAYGVLARTVDVAYVHGHLYITPVPLAGPREQRRPPPSAAVWLLARLHPEFRRRTKAATRALACRPWRDACERWFAEERHEWRTRNGAVEAQDPAAMTDPLLAGHLRACRAHVVAGYRRHFELHGDDLLPLGLLIARCEEWGIAPAMAVSALAGASDADRPADEPAAWQLITGYDLDSLAWCELAGPGPSRAAGIERRVDQPVDLAGTVAADDRPELDQLLSDARGAAALRDDNGVLTAAWPMGLLRRAMLEAGRRLALDDPGDAVDLTVDELERRLDGEARPSAEQARTRREQRLVDSQRSAPATLGPDFAVPPLTALPRPLALIGAAQLAAADHMMTSSATQAPTALGIGDRPYTGRALVVRDAADAYVAIEPGDVVITEATSPTWNVVLAQAGALVTSAGGLLSHAAVIARELAIPAVIGDTQAMTRVITGDLVTVDPRRATLTPAAASTADLGAAPIP